MAQTGGQIVAATRGKHLAPASRLDRQAADAINEMLQDLVGRTLSRCRRTAANEVFIEFGRLRRIGNYPHGPPRFETPWLVRSRGTTLLVDWPSNIESFSSRGRLGTADDRVLKLFVGQRVRAALLQYPTNNFSTRSS